MWGGGSNIPKEKTSFKEVISYILSSRYLEFYRSSARTIKFFKAIFQKQKKSYFAIGLLQGLLMSALAIGFPYLAKLETDQLVDKNNQLFSFIYTTPYGIFLVILFIILFAKIFQELLNHIFEFFIWIDRLLFNRTI